MKRSNEYFNKLYKTNEDYVIASDTDSIYANMALVKLTVATDKDKIVKALDVFCREKLEIHIVNNLMLNLAII